MSRDVKRSRCAATKLAKRRSVRWARDNGKLSKGKCAASVNFSKAAVGVTP